MRADELGDDEELGDEPRRRCGRRAAGAATVPARKPRTYAAARPDALPAAADALDALAAALRALDERQGAPCEHCTGSDEAGGPEPIALGVKEAAAHIGVSSWTLRTLINAGELPTVWIGGRRLLRVADLAAYVAGLAVAEPPGAEGEG
jgi:excisionase family DNA binding protein